MNKKFKNDHKKKAFNNQSLRRKAELEPMALPEEEAVNPQPEAVDAVRVNDAMPPMPVIEEPELPHEEPVETPEQDIVPIDHPEQEVPQDDPGEPAPVEEPEELK